MVPALTFPIVRQRTQASAIPGLEFCDLRDLLVSKHRFVSSDVVTFSIEFFLEQPRNPCPCFLPESASSTYNFEPKLRRGSVQLC